MIVALTSGIWQEILPRFDAFSAQKTAICRAKGVKSARTLIIVSRKGVETRPQRKTTNGTVEIIQNKGTADLLAGKGGEESHTEERRSLVVSPGEREQRSRTIRLTTLAPFEVEVRVRTRAEEKESQAQVERGQSAPTRRRTQSSLERKARTPVV